MALQAHCAAQIRRYCRWALRSTFSAINGKAQHSGGTTCSYLKDPASEILPQMLTSRKYVPFSQKLSGSAFSQVLSDRVFSNQAAKVQMEDEAKRRWHFPVAVGSTFVVNLSREAPEFTVGVNNDPETITIHCDSGALQLDFQENVITLTAEDDLRDGVQAWVPERFCTIDVKAGLGAISVANINQGNLRVETQGGAVDFGKIRSEHVTIKTEGGAVKAKVLSGAISVHSKGGPLTLGQVIGNEVVLNSGGGDCRIKSVYAESFNLHSEGGAIHIETLGTFGLRSSRRVGTPFEPAPAQSRVQIAAGKGDIRIDKLDGAVSLQNSGGNVTLQLTEGTQLLDLQMDGGELTLSVPPTETVQGHAMPSSPQMESQGDSLIISSKFTDPREALARITRDWKCKVVLAGTPSRIIIRRGRGWMDALRERLGNVDRT